jgi:hypothetical protein
LFIWTNRPSKDETALELGRIADNVVSITDMFIAEVSALESDTLNE